MTTNARSGPIIGALIAHTGQVTLWLAETIGLDAFGHFTRQLTPGQFNA